MIIANLIKNKLDIMSRYFILLFILLITINNKTLAQGIFGEKNDFTRQDTLRGTITAEREWCMMRLIVCL